MDMDIDDNYFKDIASAPFPEEVEDQANEHNKHKVRFKFRSIVNINSKPILFIKQEYLRI